jgi:hypothetical protein
MLGYTDKDTTDMLEGIYYAIELVDHNETKRKLALAADFFEGLIAEGYIDNE